MTKAFDHAFQQDSKDSFSTFLHYLGRVPFRDFSLRSPTTDLSYSSQLSILPERSQQSKSLYQDWNHPSYA
jgi:hypothetical protein